MIAWLGADDPFPAVRNALDEPNGLLAASRDCTSRRLLDAYQAGIFPWYEAGQPVLWWSPDPRMVLFPDRFRVSRSLRKTLRAAAADPRIDLRVDSAFETVMRHCAAPRSGQDGTWITETIVRAYCALAEQGLAHSIEVWADGDLIGGLYGVGLGRMFYGESMFSRVRDGSKIALAGLVALLLREGVPVIDCQQNTRHLASLGGCEIPRQEFCRRMRDALVRESVPWGAYRNRRLNELLESH